MTDNSDHQSPNIIIGIDPSSLHVGYAVTSVSSDKLYILERGVFNVKPTITKTSHLDYDRFYSLYNQVARLTLEYMRLDNVHVAIEECYIGSGYQSSIALATARGIQLVPFIVMSHSNNWKIFEYSPATVKKIAEGHGRASKQAMIEAARRLYDIPDSKKLVEHEADALLVVYTHYLMHKKEWNNE